MNKKAAESGVTVSCAGLMPFITSDKNPRVRRVCALRDKAKERKETGCFVSEGFRMVMETPSELLSELYVSESFLREEGRFSELLSRFPERERITPVSDEVMRKMADTSGNQGVLAVTKMPAFSLESLFEKSPAMLLFLEHLQDPGNLGTIFRTAEGAGANGLILSGDTVDCYMPKVTRATMGSIFRVPHVIVRSLTEAVAECQARGVTVFAAHLRGEDLYRGDTDLTKPVGFLIGNEGNGLSEELSERADRLLKIPMEGQLESLNAGVAASLLLYETKRQRLCRL